MAMLNNQRVYRFEVVNIREIIGEIIYQLRNDVFFWGGSSMFREFSTSLMAVE